MSEKLFYSTQKSADSGVGDEEQTCRESTVLCDTECDSIYRLSGLPIERKSTQYWNGYHFGNVLSGMRTSRSKSVIILLLLLFVSVMVMTSFAYFHIKNDLDATKQDVYELKVKMVNLKRKSNTGQVATDSSKNRNLKALLNVKTTENTGKKASFIAINLIGRNNQLEETVAGHPIADWAQTLLVGNIAKFHEYITIKVTGYYYVYAQMFFSGNASFRKDTLHFFIRKNRRKILVVASVPRKACMTVCTRYVSRVVKLEKGEDLAVSSYDSGIKFNMSKDKTQFGIYLLKELE